MQYCNGPRDALLGDVVCLCHSLNRIHEGTDIGNQSEREKEQRRDAIDSEYASSDAAQVEMVPNARKYK